MSRVVEFEDLEDITVVRVTEKALLVRLDSGSEHWVPKSVVREPEQFEAGEEYESIGVADWFVAKEELE